ncbi:hypothetical protein CR513_27747, partial [Mucuna pruriens]
MEKISSRLERSDEKLVLLSNKMRRYYHQLTVNISRLKAEWKNTRFGEASNAKEREIRKLKAQLQDLDNYIERKMKERQDLPPDPYAFIPSSLPTYRTPFQQPSSSLFSSPQKTWTLPTASAYRTRTKLESSSGIFIPKTSNQSPKDSPESSPERPPPSSLEKQTISKKDDFHDSQDPYSQFTIKLCSVDESNTQPESSSEVSEEDKDYVDLSNILMATTMGSVDRTKAIYDSPDDEVISSPPRISAPKPNCGPWFTLDDIPPSR